MFWSSPPKLLLFAALVSLLFLSGCNMNVFHDSISTTVEMSSTEAQVAHATSKRFKFERDVAGAKSARIQRAWVSVDLPEGQDLSFIASVDVTMKHPDTGEILHLVTGGGFKPGESVKELEVLYGEDIRDMVRDQRVTLDWDVQPNLLYRGFSEEEQMLALRFGIVLEIEVP